jgi:hypothetical protein
MRSKIRSVLALTVLFAARAIHAQAGDPNPAPGSAPRPSGVTPGEQRPGIESEKQKDRILHFLDVTKALARWTPSEASFLNVLGGVQDQVAVAKESDLAPMGEFTPYLSDLTAALSRMEARVSPLHSAAELCDPSRKRDLFLLFLDALDVDGQRPVQARICEKFASEQEAESGLSRVCIGTSLAFFAAQSIHDLTVLCDPSLARAPSDTNAAQIDRLSAELKTVQANVENSVRSAKKEMTSAVTFVAQNVAEVSSVQTKQLQDLTVRLEIERALQQGLPYGSIYLPAANGGRLEAVRSIVSETIQNVVNSGETANGASDKLAAGDIQLKGGHFKEAFRLYCVAYKAAVGPSSKQPASPPAHP